MDGYSHWWSFVTKVEVIRLESSPMRDVSAEVGLSSTIYLAYASCFSAIAPSLLPKRDLLCSWYCLSCFWFCQSSFLCIWENVLPTCCSLRLSYLLSSSFLSCINPTYNDTHLSLSLRWSSCLHTWGKTVAHSVWLCYHHVTKHLNTVASYTILVLIFMIKAKLIFTIPRLVHL